MLARSLAALTLTLAVEALLIGRPRLEDYDELPAVTQLYQGLENETPHKLYRFYLDDDLCEADITPKMLDDCQPNVLNVTVKDRFKYPKLDFEFSNYYFSNIHIKRKTNQLSAKCEGKAQVWVYASCYLDNAWKIRGLHRELSYESVPRRVPASRSYRHQAGRISIYGQ